MTLTPTPPRATSADLQDQALDWFVRERAGLDAAGRAALQAWLAAAPEHAQAFERCRRQWNELDELPAEGIAGLRRQLAADLARQRPPPRPRWSWAHAAAAAMLLMLAGAGSMAWRHWQQQPLYAQAFSTARGQQMALTLPDGSRLRLDTATRGEVALYRDRRELRLPEGQVMFEVARDAERPFNVLAGPLRITVLGTRFAVRYTPISAADGRVHVAVEEGHVRVAASQAAEAGTADLIAGQQVDSDTTGHLGAVRAAPADGIAGWRSGRLSFEDASLAEVLAEFERYGATGLVLKDPRVATLRLTGTFDPRHLENFRRVLPQVLPVRLQARGDLVEIQAAP